MHPEQPPVNVDQFDVPHDPLGLLHVPLMTVIIVIRGHTVVVIQSYSHSYTVIVIQTENLQ